MSFAEHLAEERRLVILRLLDQMPEYTANDSVLSTGLGDVGLRCTRDQVRTDLAWLEEQGLVTIERMIEGRVLVATLTARGSDVQAGRAAQPGVKRPSPR